MKRIKILIAVFGIVLSSMSAIAQPGSFSSLSATKFRLAGTTVKGIALDTAFKGANIKDSLTTAYDAKSYTDNHIKGFVQNVRVSNDSFYQRKDNIDLYVYKDFGKWSQAGNIVNAGTSILGTLNNASLKLYTNNTPRVQVDSTSGAFLAVMHFLQAGGIGNGSIGLYGNGADFELRSGLYNGIKLTTQINSATGISLLGGKIALQAANANYGGIVMQGATASRDAALDIQSTVQGFRLPHMTTAQRNDIQKPLTGITVTSGGTGYTSGATSVFIQSNHLYPFDYTTLGLTPTVVGGVITAIAAPSATVYYNPATSGIHANPSAVGTGTGAVLAATYGASAPTDGLQIYNTDANTIQFYSTDSSKWLSVATTGQLGAGGGGGGGSGDMVAANNLGDLTNTTTARANLGLGTLATQNGTFSGVSSNTNTGDETLTTIKSKLGVSTLSGSNTGDQDLSGLAVKSANLSDLTSATLARSNLGLGTASIVDLSTTTALGTSNILLPTQNAVKTYVDAGLATKAATFGTQTANTIYSGPSSGGVALPTFRNLVIGDIPNLASVYQPLNANLTGIGGLSAPTDGQYITTVSGTYIWDDLPTELPSPTGETGNFLSYNGSSVVYKAGVDSSRAINDSTLREYRSNGTFFDTEFAPAGTGDAVIANSLAQFPAGSVTSAQLRTLVNDETGSGFGLVFAQTPTFSTYIIDPKVKGGASSGATLSFQASSAATPTSASSIKFLGGNDGADEFAKFDNLGNLGLGIIVPTSTFHDDGSFALDITQTATSMTLDGTEHTIEVTATGQTVTLPTAVGIKGRIYTIILTAAGSATVATTSSQLINASTTYTSLNAIYKYVTVQSNNVKWLITGNN